MKPGIEPESAASVAYAVSTIDDHRVTNLWIEIVARCGCPIICIVRMKQILVACLNACTSSPFRVSFSCLTTMVSSCAICQAGSVRRWLLGAASSIAQLAPTAARFDECVVCHKS